MAGVKESDRLGSNCEALLCLRKPLETCGGGIGWPLVACESHMKNFQAFTT